MTSLEHIFGSWSLTIFLGWILKSGFNPIVYINRSCTFCTLVHTKFVCFQNMNMFPKLEIKLMGSIYPAVLVFPGTPLTSLAV